MIKLISFIIFMIQKTFFLYPKITTSLFVINKNIAKKSFLIQIQVRANGGYKAGFDRFFFIKKAKCLATAKTFLWFIVAKVTCSLKAQHKMNSDRSIDFAAANKLFAPKDSNIFFLIYLKVVYTLNFS